MFRKKKSSSNPPAQPAATPSATSATSAAALAFLNKRASDASLSASAAAAALRSHTTSPQPVGAVQTKRMIRRGSVSSSVEGSPVGSLRQSTNGGIQRSASSTSMRERSFRSPSPAGRKAPTPLPTLHDEVPPLPPNFHSRNPSNETTASTNAGRSSTPLTVNTNATQTGFSERRTTVKYDPHTRTVVRVPIENRVQSGNPGSPRSVNFSRPMSPPVSYNSSAREQVRPRPASALGHSTVNSSRDRPPMPAGASQIAALKLQAKAQAATTASPAAPQRPSSSAGTPAGALVAASLAARPTSTSVTPGSSLLPANTSTRPGAARPSSVASATQAPPETKTRAVSSQTALTSASAATLSAAAAAPREPAPAGPSQEEISNFQMRAAAMLARPLTDTAAMSSAEADATPVQSGPSTTSQVRQVPVAATDKPEQPKLGVSGGPPARTSSTSPSRMAHFSQLPVVENLKHQPPPRDLSPAKSALKAPSPRPSSPAGSRISETSSVHSDDGTTSTQKKKKSVRVSFDENAVLVGDASSPMTPASNTIMSPQYKKDTIEPWSSDDDGAYAPRPALPSFGSVRGRKSPPPEKDDLPTERSSEAFAASSDQVSTAIETESQSVVLTGYKDNKMTESVPKSSTDTETLSEPVPFISVLPATPRIDESKNLDESVITDAGKQRGIPVGGIAESETAAMETAADQPTVSHTNARDLVQSGELDSEDNFSDAPEDPSQLNVDGGTQSLDAIIESPSAEASLQPPFNVRSKGVPISDELTGHAVAAAEPVETAPPPTETEDWERIRRYWNSLSEQRKQELESEASKNVAASEFASPVASASPPADLPVANGTGVSAAGTRSKGQPPLPPWPDKQYQTSVNAKPSGMKQTMRASHQRAGSEPTHMRTSMRDVAQPTTASKERVPPPKSSQRPSSAVAPTSSAGATTAGSLQAATNAAKPKLERTLSNDSSASESSFRRKRGTSVASSEGAGYTMKRTMRGAPQADAAPPMSVTQQKPDRSNFQSMSASSKKGMQSSLRSSVDSTTSTMRSSNQQASKQRTSKLGFGKSSKGGSRFKSRFNDSSDEDEDSKPWLGFRSRFDDSDDEAEAPSSALGSPTKLTPVRGIPKKAGRASGDSTDLDDSDDAVATPNITSVVSSKLKPSAKPAVQPETPTTPTNANGVTGGTALKTGTLRTEKPGASPQAASPQANKTKRGFFGIGRKKKAPTESSTSQPASPIAAISSPKVVNTATSNNTATQETTSSPKVTNISTSKIISTQETTSSPKATNISTSKITSTEETTSSPKVTNMTSNSTATQGTPSSPKVTNMTTSNSTATQGTPSSPTTRTSRFLRRLSSSGDVVLNETTTTTVSSSAAPQVPPLPAIPTSFSSDAGTPQATPTEERPNTAEAAVPITIPKTLRPTLGDKRDSAMTAPEPGTEQTADRPEIYSGRTGKKKKFQGLRRMLGVHN